MWSVRNKLAFLLLIASMGLFYFGVTEPMLNITALGHLQAGDFVNMDSQVLNKSQSILQAVWDLVEQDNLLTALLIFLFSVVVPILKAVLLCAVFFSTHQALRVKLYRFVHTIAKWSMADVFVVAIFITYLATRDQVQGTRKDVAVMGFRFPLEVSMELSSFLQQGFYYFTAYCLLSMLTTQLVDPGPHEPGL